MTGAASGFSASAPSASVVDAAGNAFFTVSSSTGTATLGCIEGDPTLITSGNIRYLLVKIAPDGSSTATTLPISQPLESQSSLRVLAPDGNGGALVQWVAGQYPNFSASVMVSSSGTVYPCPLPNGIAQLVRGQNGVAFATDGQNLATFPIATGHSAWTYQAQTPGILSLGTATDGGGLVTKFSKSSGSDSVIRFDSNGTPSTDTWTSLSASNMGASAITNVSFFAGNAFLATTLGSAQPFLAQSDATVDYPGEDGWTSEPDDGREKSIHLTLTVYQVQGTTINSNDSIQSQVQKAQNIWSSKIQDLHLDWNGTVNRTPVCDQSQLPPPHTCAEPETHLDNFGVPDGCGSTIATLILGELVFRNAGINILFTNNLLYDPPLFGSPNPIEQVQIRDEAACNNGRFLFENYGEMSNQAYNTTLAHAVGHMFGLIHPKGNEAAGPPRPGNQDGNNLMCSGDATYCPDPSRLGSYLTPQQIEDAKRGLLQWHPTNN